MRESPFARGDIKYVIEDLFVYSPVNRLNKGFRGWDVPDSASYNVQVFYFGVGASTGQTSVRFELSTYGGGVSPKIAITGMPRLEFLYT